MVAGGPWGQRSVSTDEHFYFKKQPGNDVTESLNANRITVIVPFDGVLVVRPRGMLFKRATADFERVADGLRVVGCY